MAETTGTVVTTFAELKDVLENKEETLVYLNADIYGEAKGIQIPNNKPDVIIDGTYDGVKHRYHDYSTTNTGVGAQADTIMVGSPAGGSFTVTMQNMYIDGVNYYGPMSSPLSNTNYRNVTYIMRGVSYHGPQVAYIGYGCVEYYDSDFFVDGKEFPISEEFAQCNRVVFGGKIRIKHSPRTSVNMFPFEGYAATRSVTIKAGADVRIDTNRIFFSGGETPFTIEDGASLYIESTTTLSPSSVYASPFTIGRGARFTYIQTSRNGTVATMYCNSDFTVAEGAAVYMEAQYDNASALVSFATTGARLSITDPESFVLRSRSAGAVNFATSTRLELQGGQINYWDHPASVDDPGGFTDIPTYPWSKADADGAAASAYVYGNTTNAAFTLDADGTNLTDDELIDKPLSALLLNAAYVFSIGRVPIALDTITDDNHPIQGISAADARIEASYSVGGEDYSVSGAAGEDGRFSLETAIAVPAGELVTVRANTPFLISQTRQEAVEPGELVMEAPPEQIAFSIRNRVSPVPVLFGRVEDDWAIQVYDSRARKSPWRIYATTDGHLKNEAGHTLPDALVYRDDEGALHTLGEQPCCIWLDESKESSVTVKWVPDMGLLIQPSTNSMHINEQYTAIINWTIESD